jgi:4-hydroxybenzoate polyprenyltransferase
MVGVGKAFRHYATLCRWEFLPATAVAILIGVFLGLEDWGYLFDIGHILILIEGLFIFFLLFNVGFMVNCWADWEVDETYKTRLSDAVKDVGRSTVGKMVVLHIVIAVVLAAHISFIITFKPVLFILVLIGTFLGVAYSVEPFRFKSKGALHSVMAFPVFSAPGLFSYFLVNDLALTDIHSQVFLLLVAGVTTAHYALVLLSQSEDHPDDKAMGIVTPAVAWGLRTTVRRALKLNLWGSTVSIGAFVLLFFLVDPDAPPYMLLLLLLLVPLVYSTSYDVYKLERSVSKARNDSMALKAIRKVMKDYTRFHGVPLGGIMLCALILMVERSMGWF